MRNKYVSPQAIQEEVNRFKAISEYAYFEQGLSEEDDNKVDQLTMDDFSSQAPPAGGAPDAGGAPPAGAPPAGAPPAGDIPPAGGAPDAGGAPPAGEDPFAAPAGGAPDAGLDPMAAPDAAAPAGDAAQEVDVTDIVNDTKAVNQKADEMNGKVDKTLAMVNQLMMKISGMESNVTKMDQALAKIDSIYKEFELSKPPSPEEVKQAMAQNSYPFNVPLSDYGREGVEKNQTEMEMKKNKLSLSNLLSDFNEKDVRNSFNPPDPFEDKVARSLPAYRM